MCSFSLCQVSSSLIKCNKKLKFSSNTHNNLSVAMKSSGQKWRANVEEATLQTKINNTLFVSFYQENC